MIASIQLLTSCITLLRQISYSKKTSFCQQQSIQVAAVIQKLLLTSPSAHIAGKYVILKLPVHLGCILFINYLHIFGCTPAQDIIGYFGNDLPSQSHD